MSSFLRPVEGYFSRNWRCRYQVRWRSSRRNYWRISQGEDTPLTLHDIEDIRSVIASGSYRVDAMIVVPCSMDTLAAIAGGLSSNLLQRAADVTLKEGRQLLLVTRETPLSAIHLENMLKLARLGVRIVPPMPAFYHHPKSISDLVDFVVGRILDQLGMPHHLYTRWESARE